MPELVPTVDERRFNQLRTVKIGCRRLVPVASLTDYLAEEAAPDAQERTRRP